MFSVHIGGRESPKALVVRDYVDRMMRRLEVARSIKEKRSDDDEGIWDGKECLGEEIVA